MLNQIKDFRPRVTKESIKWLGALFFSLFLMLAAVAFGFDKNLQSDVRTLKPDDWFYYKSNNDVSAYLGKKGSSLPTVRYHKDNDYLEFSMTKAGYFTADDPQFDTHKLSPVSSSTAVSMEMDVKKPNTPTLFYRNILDGVDVNYQITSLPFKVKEEIVLKENSRFKIQNPEQAQTTFLFSAETSANPVKQKDGSIAFFNNQNKYLFHLDKPFMVDNKGERSEKISIDVINVEKTKPLQTNNAFSFQLLTSNLRSSIFSAIIGVTNFQFLKPLEKFIENFKPVNRSDGLRTGNPASRQYIIILNADHKWLTNAAYPVIIDPTITHNSDANFTGQMNRIADNDSTSSTQLESSYGENANDPYTVLNLHFNEANGTTAGIRDYASSTRVITANGNASTTNYVTQLGLGNSAAFDGTGDWFTVPDSDEFFFGTRDFSIDFWVKFKANTGNMLFLNQVTSTNDEFYWYVNHDANTVQLVVDGPAFNFVSPWDPITNTWYHVALTRSGNDWRHFIDGVQIGATVNSQNISNKIGTPYFGSRGVGESPLNGYLDDYRITKGRALTPEEIKAAASRRPYAVYTSPVEDATASVAWNTLNWTEGGVATGNGEQPYNTNSLVAQWDFNDTSGTTLTASSSGSCTTACNGTLTNFASTASQDQASGTGWTNNNKRWGAGALMFDGTNDYVSVPDSENWNFGSGDFSINSWIKFKASTDDQMIFAQGTDGTHSQQFYMRFSTNKLVYVIDAGVIGSDVLSWSWTPSIGTWYYLSLVRSGSSWTAYVNGISLGVATPTSPVGNYTSGFIIGANWNGATNFLNGIMDSFSVYKGRTLSATEILSNYNSGNIEIQTRTGATSDPNDGTWGAWKPTTGETQLLNMDSDAANWNAPGQIDGYTKLLLHMDGADAAATFPNSATTTHTVTAVNQAQIDTAQSKFSGSSALFDGTLDGVRVDGNADFAFAADFTIDTWIRTTSTANMHFYGTTNEAAWTTDAWHVGYYNGNLVFGVATSANTQTFASGSLHDGNWHHIVITRSGSTIRMFADGVEKGSFTDSRTLGNATFRNAVGAQDPTMSSEAWNGHLDEFRISKGIARWTSNFTPPPRAYGSNVKAENETTIKQEGNGSTKLTLGAPQVDGNTVALWHFEETGGTTGTYLYDETANNNDATTTGTTVVDGIFGKARKFNGTSDYVHLQNSSSLQISTISISGWVKRENAGTAGHIVGYGTNGWALYFGADNVLNFAKLGISACVSTGTITDTAWHLISVTYDASTCRFYVDGVSIGGPTYANPTFSFTTNLAIGAPREGSPNFKGTIDEMAVYNRVLSPDEIAETYRMGANHHLTRQVSATDLSSANKLAFNVAADRPGNYLEAMLGESDYANYELASSTLAISTNTVLYIKGDEIASSTSIKDSSFSGKAITANGNARTAGNGKIGNSVYFDGTGDYLSTPANADFVFGAGNFTIDAWVNLASYPPAYATVFSNLASWTATAFNFRINPSGALQFSSGTVDILASSNVVPLAKWAHIAVTRSGTTLKLFVNSVEGGSLENSSNFSEQNIAYMGALPLSGGGTITGNLDEFRILKGTALTPDQIRQAYEYGLRTHPITIDFGATLQSSDLISSATDYNFSLTATTSGLSATTSGLYLGDKIIIKENLGGTEYTAQGTVNAINTATGAITVPSWDTGSTFPASAGYSPNATVFKWQREYFDLTGAATTTRDAITNLTLRPTNGAEGRTIYLDDFRYNTNYLTASSSSPITSSNGRYLQYRAIFSSWDTFVSPYLSAINTLYTLTSAMFPPTIGVSGGGFLSF